MALYRQSENEIGHELLKVPLGTTISLFQILPHDQPTQPSESEMSNSNRLLTITISE